MHSLPPAAALVAAIVSLCACSGGGGQEPPAPMSTPSSTVTIAVSKSTNSSAYSIVLSRSADATVTQGGTTSAASVSPAHAAAFFRDLDANTPVAKVPTEQNCPKSASFGTTTIVTYEDSTSGDISCAPSRVSSAATLFADEQNIANDVSAVIPLGR